MRRPAHWAAIGLVLWLGGPASLRAAEPVRRMPDGSYFLTRYDDLATVYRDAQTFSSDKKVDAPEGPRLQRLRNLGHGGPLGRLYRQHPDEHLPQSWGQASRHFDWNGAIWV